MLGDVTRDPIGRTPAKDKTPAGGAGRNQLPLTRNWQTGTSYGDQVRRPEFMACNHKTFGLLVASDSYAFTHAGAELPRDDTSLVDLA